MTEREAYNLEVKNAASRWGLVEDTGILAVEVLDEDVVEEEPDESIMEWMFVGPVSSTGVDTEVKEVIEEYGFSDIREYHN